jgi:LemA protein
LAVTQARSGLLQATQAVENNPTDANAMATLASSQMALDGAMGGFNLKMEDYPELKASENMMQLAEELTSTENRIASARQGYNDLQASNQLKKKKLIVIKYIKTK